MTPEPVKAAPNAAVSAVRRHVLRWSVLAALSWAGAAVAAALVVAWLLAGPGGWGGQSGSPALLDGALAVVLGCLAAAWIRYRNRELAERRVAAAMDEAAGLPPGSVLGAVELSRVVPGGVSPGLALRGVRGIAARLDGDPRELAGLPGRRARRFFRRGAGALVALAVVLVGLGTLAPERAASAWFGLLRPVELLEGPELLPLSLEPGDAEVLRGAPFQVLVSAPDRNEVTLRWRSSGDVPRERALAVNEGAASYTFADVAAETEYWAEAPDGAATERFVVTPVDPLFVTGLTVELTFPSHTGRLPEEYRDEVPPLTVPVGTRLQLRGRASRDLNEVSLESPEAGGVVELRVEGARFDGSWIPRRSGAYRWSVIGSGGDSPQELPAPLEVTLVPDSAPTVTFLFPGRDTTLPLSQRQPLVIQGRDDYGVTRLELEAVRVSVTGEVGEPLLQRLDAGGSRGVLARPVLDVSRWGLVPGDTVRYRARVVDNAPEPSQGATPWYSLRVPRASELMEEAARELRDLTTAVEELAEDAGEAEEDARDLEREALSAAREAGARSGTRPDPARSEELTFQEREELQDAVERQEELLARADSVGAELGELSRSMRDAGAPDPELRSDLAELQELMDEIATPELRERLDELSRALDRRDVEEAREALEDLASDQAEMRRRLEESLDRFRRAAVEQEFRAVSSEAQELADEQAALAEAMAEADDMELRAEQQEGLEERAGGLEERMETLEERLASLGEQDARQGSADARERAAEAREAMEEAARSARTSERSQATESASQASRAMDEAARELQEAAQDMSEEWREAVRQALREAASDALTLARRQGELNRDPRQQGPAAARSDLRGDQAAVLQGARNMAESMSRLSRVSPEVDRSMSTLMGRAMAQMEEAMQAMAGEGSTPGGAEAAGRAAVEALNQTALTAVMNGQQVGEGQGQGEGQTADALMEQLEALAQQQGQLMSQSGSILPMQLGEEANSEQARQMSSGQEAVAGELGDLAREQGPDSRALGDLEALAEEARALARELAGGRLDPEVAQRQERLFHRLLDAGRSLEKDELSDRRESRSARVVAPRDVPALTPRGLGALRFALPGSGELQALPPAQRRLVLEYFRRLNRGDGGGRP